MKHETIKIPVCLPFDFRSMLNSHGWVDLLPNIHNPVIPSFSRVEETPSGNVVLMNVSAEHAGDGQGVAISVTASHQLGSQDKVYLARAVRHMLRLDEDFSEFYDHCKLKGGTWGEIRIGTGHLLRSPTVFEDLVKVICTTNIQWGGTKWMVRELVEAFGKLYLVNPGLKTFPSPSSIASIPFDEFKQKVRLGYRTDYVYRVALQFVNGELNPSDFLAMDTPAGEIQKRLLAIKGFGNYAAASMLMLLGRYDRVPVDSVFRQFMAAKYFKDRPFSLPEALAIYDDWGKWKYLAYWFDMVNFENQAET
jgi:3-methyladenine DNA glycosylase/8-oxoguanine DNA glycosylase